MIRSCETKCPVCGGENYRMGLYWDFACSNQDCYYLRKDDNHIYKQETYSELMWQRYLKLRLFW